MLCQSMADALVKISRALLKCDAPAPGCPPVRRALALPAGCRRPSEEPLRTDGEAVGLRCSSFCSGSVSRKARSSLARAADGEMDAAEGC